MTKIRSRYRVAKKKDNFNDFFQKKFFEIFFQDNKNHTSRGILMRGIDCAQLEIVKSILLCSKMSFFVFLKIFVFNVFFMFFDYFSIKTYKF